MTYSKTMHGVKAVPWSAGITHVWACACRTETPCQSSDHAIGAIFTCPGCKKTFGRRESGKWIEMKIVPETFDPGEGWRLVTHPDGTQQVHSFAIKWPPQIFIERVVCENSRRKRWCVVDRRPPGDWDKKKYAPKLAGPFPSLDAAKAAYLMILAAGS